MKTKLVHLSFVLENITPGPITPNTSGNLLSPQGDIALIKDPENPIFYNLKNTFNAAYFAHTYTHFAAVHKALERLIVVANNARALPKALHNEIVQAEKTLLDSTVVIMHDRE